MTYHLMQLSTRQPAGLALGSPYDYDALKKQPSNCVLVVVAVAEKYYL